MPSGLPIFVKTYAPMRGGPSTLPARAGQIPDGLQSD
jgi:hypothetical protein